MKIEIFFSPKIRVLTPNITIKFVGIYIDENLKWKENISALAKEKA